MRKVLQVLIVLITIISIAQTITIAKENGGANSSVNGPGDKGGHDPGV